jgi:hypothetical protein
MKKVILFWPGASGHFLAEFMSSNNTTVDPTFRMDIGSMRKAGVFASDLLTIQDLIVNDTRETILSHYMNISDLSEFYNDNWIKKIYPGTNLIGLIKNIFYKKQQVEVIDWSQANYQTQFDGYFENIKNWYFEITQDVDLPQNHLIDFGQLQDIDFLKDLYCQFYNQEPARQKIDFAKSYIDKQDRIINDVEFLNIEEIIDFINPSSLLEIALVLFLYEKNHNTVDQNRDWTIDELPGNLDSALRFLTNNAKAYTIF